MTDKPKTTNRRGDNEMKYPPAPPHPNDKLEVGEKVYMFHKPGPLFNLDRDPLPNDGKPRRV